MTVPKIDRFTILLSIILVLCAGLLIFTFRSIFNAFTLSYDVSGNENTSLKIDTAKFEEAKFFVKNKKSVVPLTVLEPEITVSVTPKPQ